MSKNVSAPFKKDELYPLWRNIISRCTNQNHKSWANYGGRGITVCEDWLDFEGFRRDMAPRPAGMQIDRIDNSAGYSRSNCHWVSSKENCRNRRSNVLVEYAGRQITVSEAAELSGISRLRIYQRLGRGCKDLFAPVQTQKRPRNLRTDNAGRWAGKESAISSLSGGSA